MTEIAPKESAKAIPTGGGSAAGERPWQFSLRSLMVFTAGIAILFAIGATFGEGAFWGVVVAMVAMVVVVTIAGYRQPSEITQLLVGTMLLQFVGASLLAPGDGGFWLFTMYRLYLAVDIFLFARLYLFYKIVQRPEPRLSWLVKTAVLTSPITVAVAATYLMENYGLFRGGRF